MIESNRLRSATIKDLAELTFLSAKAWGKQLYIFEKSDLSKLIGYQKAEEARQIFLENKIKIKQITNIKNLESFSKNDEFVNECMSFRYVPKSVYQIDQEILIFDDNVYIYTLEPEIKILHIKDTQYAESQMRLFLNLWESSTIPNLTFQYKPEPSFYKSFDLEVNGKQFIIYPDIESKIAWGEITRSELQEKLVELINENSFLSEGSSYFVCFLWSNDDHKMIDIWKFSANNYDERSGPLSDAYVFEDFKKCDVKGIASGNTLLVLGYEERKRRQSNNLSDYLNGAEPQLPFDLIGEEEF